MAEDRLEGTGQRLSIADVDRMGREEFVSRFGSLFEHSPWVAEGAWDERPFGSVDGLHDAFVRAVRDAPEERRAALIRAHPDLAGKAAGVPVYKLLGGYRDKVPAYGSTMCGDELEGGLSTPEEYAAFMRTLIERVPNSDKAVFSVYRRTAEMPLYRIEKISDGARSTWLTSTWPDFWSSAWITTLSGPNVPAGIATSPSRPTFSILPSR